MFTFNSRNTRTKCHLFKINNRDSRAMISFCLGVDWVPWHMFKTNIYLLKVSNIHTRIRCGICSKLTMNSTERYKWRRNDIFFDNFEHVSLIIQCFCLLDLLNITQKRSGKSFVSNVSNWNTQFGIQIGIQNFVLFGRSLAIL